MSELSNERIESAKVELDFEDRLPITTTVEVDGFKVKFKEAGFQAYGTASAVFTGVALSAILLAANGTYTDDDPESEKAEIEVPVDETGGSLESQSIPFADNWGFDDGQILVTGGAPVTVAITDIKRDNDEANLEFKVTLRSGESKVSSTVYVTIPDAAIPDGDQDTAEAQA